MPVNRELQIGVSAPTLAPTTGPSNNPASSTGICIGKNTDPMAPTAWKAMGSKTPMATKTAPLIQLRNTAGCMTDSSSQKK